MTATYLLDTNHLSRAVEIGSPVRLRITELAERGAKVGTCVPVLCEVEAGIHRLREPEKYRQGLDRLLRRIRVWPMLPSTARVYGGIYQDLRTRGRALSQVDMMLAALATEMSATLVTSDKDFTALPDIRVESWFPAVP